MQQRTGRSWITTVALTLFLLLMLPGFTLAAEAPKVSQGKIVVDFGADGTDTVQATYTVTAVDGLPDGVLEHLWVTRPGSAVSDIQVTGDGQSPTITEGKGITRVKVKLTANPATYTLQYKVQRESGSFSVPVFTPNLPVAKPEPNVLIESILPPGQVLAGENFPAVVGEEVREGRNVQLHRVINVPSAVIAEYGSARRVSLSDVITVAAVLLLVSVMFFWFRYMVKTTEVSQS